MLYPAKAQLPAWHVLPGLPEATSNVTGSLP